MKKILSLLIVFALVGALLVPAHAASASVSLRPGANSYTVGSTVKVTITVSGDANIGSWQYSLNYDASMLQYLSGADSGGGGVVHFSDSSDGQRTVTQTVNFRALAIGKANLSISSPLIIAFDDLSRMNVGGASCSVSIVAAPTLSGENNLSTLEVAGGELTPAFSANTTAYTLTVPYEVTSLVLNATPKDSKAKVALSDTALNVGENDITITVTAENGSRKVYTIRVTRQESVYAGVTAQVDGKTYNVGYDLGTLTPPAGYEARGAVFGDQQIMTFVSPGETLSVVYLFAEDDAAWFRFDAETGSFTRCVWLQNAASTLVPLSLPEDAVLPDGFQEITLDTSFGTFQAYGNEESDTPNLRYFYAMRSDGTVGYFFYDTETGLVFPYFELAKAEPEEPDEEGSRELRQAEAERDAALALKDKAEIMSILLGIALVVTLIVIVLVLFLKRKKKAAPEKEILLMDEDAPIQFIAEEDPSDKIVKSDDHK